MGIHYKNTRTHWNYFLALEKDFELLARYIEFSEENNNTFSIELARIIMSSTQEVDVIMKSICTLLGNTSADNINQYRTTIKKKLSGLINEEVFIPRFGMSSTPWLNWNEKDENPIWWKANNKIKHQRTSHFQKANLKNAFNALGALLIVNLYFYKLEKEKEIENVVDWKDITSELNSRDSFMKLRDKYYHESVFF
ncbi:hypothetical protein [Hwangdonia seohaensis]|uniref:Uncharacterized protein n=1 Tax=Hwangdonia seohaensis TaxID=1240727 RepID=A0ABW3REC0_9FLAO|nr:hypothetical protein [Hwangdonia seohaensis]